MVFHSGDQHFWLRVCVDSPLPPSQRGKQVFKRSRQQVQRLGGASGEDDFFGFLCVDEIRYGLAGVFVCLGRFLAQIMHTSVDVAVLVQIIVALALNDAQRFLRGGGIVEIDQRLSVNLLV